MLMLKKQWKDGRSGRLARGCAEQPVVKRIQVLLVAALLSCELLLKEGDVSYQHEGGILLGLGPAKGVIYVVNGEEEVALCGQI